MRKTLIPVVALLLAAPAAAQSTPEDNGRLKAKAVYVVQQPPPPPPAQPARPARPSGRVVVGGRDGREEQQETFTKSVRLGNTGVLDISNLVGNIEITRGSGGDATIQVTKVARARSVEEAKALLPLVVVDITSRGDRAEIRTQYPSPNDMRERRNMNVSVHFKIAAPQGTRIIAQSLAGDLKVTDIRGELSLTTTSGSVSITNAARVSSARSTSGNVEITNVDSDVALDAGTISGDVIVRDVKARRMKLGTVTGRVLAQNVVTEILGAQTFNGDVEVIGPLTKGGRYDLKAHAGDVRIVVTGGGGFYLEASSWSGEVKSDFPLPSPDARGGRSHRKTVSGMVGDGGATINVTTFSGDVFVVKK